MRYLLFLTLLLFPFVKSLAQTATDSTNNWFDLIEQISKDTSKTKSLFGNEDENLSQDTSQTQNDPAVSIVTENSEVGGSDVSSGTNSESDAQGDTIDDIFKPEIGFGAGLITYFGDVNDSYRKNPDVGQIGRNLIITRKINDYLSVNFFAMKGVLTGNERTPDRNLNFKTDILLGGTSFTYNFYHVFKAQKTIMPFVSLGLESFEFNSKGDLYDKNGNYYYYWSDGSIRNISENAPNAGNSILLQRDYVYETDLRELNADQFGQYPQVSFSMPIDFGVDVKVTNWITMRLGNSFHFSFNDLIDNINSKGQGVRKGSAGTDKFMYTYFSFRFNLFSIFSQSDEDKKYNSEDFLSINGDEDADGVLDFSDLCPGTPVGAVVDLNGCPADSDGDGIRDPNDTEQFTSSEVFTIDENGVGKSEDDYLASAVNDSLAVTIQESMKKTVKLMGNVFETESEIPDRFKIFDTDKDGYISPEELTQAFDMFFDFDTNLTLVDMYMLNDFFFDQTLNTDK